MELLFWQKLTGRPQCFFCWQQFINDSDEFGKIFVARIAFAHAFKKTNTNVTEQLTSNIGLALIFLTKIVLVGMSDRKLKKFPS